MILSEKTQENDRKEFLKFMEELMNLCHCKDCEKAREAKSKVKAEKKEELKAEVKSEKKYYTLAELAKKAISDGRYGEETIVFKRKNKIYSLLFACGGDVICYHKIESVIPYPVSTRDLLATDWEIVE